ncbi:hypothetical protein LEN26_004310 [Aphanomyces euteiches]|nr:hypothetical protein AeMF1_010990 [Aphanomyces euteiches]KAH9149261.1 hypothetical protein LEN26_004310 [Aphanomyces euteiches]KAH9193538.1 hypothetical protein AeNC1_004484 [Aphanomyces euteiches]
MNEECKMTMEDLTCAVCLEPLASPITLYCGHTFDRECLVHLVAKSCPMCRQCEIKPDVIVQPKNQLVYKIVLSMWSNASDEIARRGADHEHVRLKRLATFVQTPKKLSVVRVLSVQWGRIVLVFHSLSFPWNAVYGPEGIHEDEEIPCCTQFWSSIACTVVVAYLVATIFSLCIP